jgi:hypothetical protein
LFQCRPDIVAFPDIECGDINGDINGDISGDFFLQ